MRSAGSGVRCGRVAACVLAAAIAIPQPLPAQELAALEVAISTAAEAETPPEEPKVRRLPFLGDEARKRGIELPQPFGIGLVYYKLKRDIEVLEVRVGRNGAPPQSVGDFAELGSTSDVDNVNLKADVWILPFLNVYAIAGTLKNESTTNVIVTLPPIRPGGDSRTFATSVPTEIDGSVGGLGVTLAGGYKSLFFAADVNGARADLGFDDRFKAVVSSLRLGWHGTAGGRPLRVWVNGTYWDTFATAKGTVEDPEGGILSFEVDQGPLYPWTYGMGASYAPTKSLEFAVDAGSDFHGGWYVALVPVFRF